MFGHSTGPTTGEFLFDAKASKFGKEDAEAEEVNNIASAVGQIGFVTGAFRVAQPYPEGITYDAANKRILLSSLTSNSIMSFDPSNGMSLTTTYTPDSANPSGMGLKVDSATGQVYATIDSFTKQDNGGLAVYDIPVTSDTEAIATVVSTVNLPCTDGETKCGLANDVILDDSGVAYVTDSSVGRLLKAEDGEIEVISDDSLLQWTDESFPFGANGMVHIADSGILLVFNTQTRSLLRIDTTWDDVAEVAINGEINGGGDGMLLSSDGILYAITGGTHITAFRSQDDWMSADVIGSIDVSTEGETATTMTFGETEDEIYVTHVRFGDLNGDGQNDDPSLIFKVSLNN
jgi:sugar lactone lactonase YvrE